MSTTNLVNHKSIHQLLIEFDGLFNGLWDLGEIDKLKFKDNHTSISLSIDDLFHILIVPMTLNKIEFLIQWYIQIHGFDPIHTVSDPLAQHTTMLSKSRVLGAVKRRFIANKRLLIRKLYKYHASETDN